MTYADKVTSITNCVFVGTAERMTAIPDESVHVCVTSPPYFGLRQYDTGGTWEGGDPACAHKRDKIGTTGVEIYRATCGLCGAVRVEDEQIGLEPTVGEYVERLVAVFREVRRVLRDDGTAWLNLGDSYFTGAGGTGTSGAGGGGQGERWREYGSHTPTNRMASVGRAAGLKPKDLIGIPWRVAFALQADGWWLRDAIVWAKPNPMPSSVADRCTPSYEMVFMLAKSRRYFADMDAVRTPLAPISIERVTRPSFDQETGGPKDYANRADGEVMGRPGSSQRKALERLSARVKTAMGPNARGARRAPEPGEPGAFHPLGANLRNVWTIATVPYPGEHFATFPPELPETCIKIGASEGGCCAACGAPRARIIIRDVGPPRPTTADPEYAEATGGHSNSRPPTDVFAQATSTIRTSGGFEPSCGCDLVEAFLPDDFEVIASPTATSDADQDPTMEVGRAGLARPRADDEGTRSMTRYEQRRYAEQLRTSPDRATMEAEAGPAFAHYTRTDSAGARPVPPALLDDWIARGLIAAVAAPARTPYPSIPCMVLDPFMGSGTTADTALRLGRRYVGYELSAKYAELVNEREAVAEHRAYAAALAGESVESGGEAVVDDLPLFGASA